MAAFCGKCGTPFGATGKFCPSCGLPRPDDAPAQPAVTAAAPQTAANAPAQGVAPKAGNSGLKLLMILLVIGVGGIVLAAGTAFYFGQKKLNEFRQAHGAAGTVDPDSASSSASASHPRSSPNDASMLLTKEEVGAIIGVPVTSIEMQGKQDALYKTATMGMETSIEFERKNEEDAIESMAAARKVTQSMFGGKAAPVASLGDEAVYGAFNVLYVRKSDLFLTIMPPRLQQVAQFKQYNDLTSQPMGSDAQKESLQKLAELSKGDPAAASLAKPDAVSGAVDLIHHAAAESGSEYDTKSREMARQMAQKVLSKL